LNPLSSALDLVRLVLETIGIVAVVNLLIKSVLKLKELRRVEAAYLMSLKFVRERLGEMGYILDKLPDEVIAEATYRGERVISSALYASLRRFVSRLKGKRTIRVMLFGELDYPEQMAFLIKSVFRDVLAFHRVLRSDLREALVTYYAYKFAHLSVDRVGRDSLGVLEREFEESKFKDLILKLDSKELSSVRRVTRGEKKSARTARETSSS